MSEANTPFNPQGQSESEAQSIESGHPTSTKKLEGAKMTNLSSKGRLPLDAHQIFDASTLDDAFEDASTTSPEAAMLPEAATSTNASPVVSNNLVSIAAWSQEAMQRPESPNLSDLIALIQELNQCNGALMDRVSQLEEALEYSQNALQAEVGRTQDVQTAYNAQDWTAVQEQITTLFNQLEFAHQTNQRQQILVETVTGQLESSQERVAELEREAALLQQRYNEQTQALQKAENTCRDLQARLQRQQRYTLQFKAALEKSLEVPTPQYEVPAIAPEVPIAITEAPFPKVQRIQPWSAQAHTSAKASAWMKVQNLEVPPQEEPIAESNQEPSKPQSESPERLQTTHLNLPAFGMPLLQVNSADETAPSPAAIDRSIEEQVQRLTTDPALKQQLDAAVKPLADMLAEALLADQQSTVAANPPANRQIETVASPSSPTSDPDPLAAVMADAEDALWQDLARLIDVSTEDVVKASLSGDLAAFESIDFAAIQENPPVSAQVTTPEEPAIPRQNPPVQKRPVAQMAKPATQAPVTSTANNPAITPDLKLADAAAMAPLIRKMAHAQAGSAGEQTDQLNQEFIPALENPSWPSPVVYPLRPTKKRQSLAMVDLPTFPQG